MKWDFFLEIDSDSGIKIRILSHNYRAEKFSILFLKSEIYHIY
jgi:hypothetical protein